jgi:O-antigen/teichoic acid export membrane protein
MAGTFIIISIFGAVFKQVDVLMLGKIKDSATVGVYSAAYRLIRLGMQLMPAFMLAIFPRMSEVHVRSPEQLGTIVAQVLKLLMALVIPLAVVVTVLAEEIISFVYGPGYQGSVPVLRALVWMFVFFTANSVLFRTMLASDNEQVTMRVACLNMLSSLLLNGLLIPRWGASGVAISSILIMFVALAQNYAYLARHLLKLDWLRLVGKPALAAAISGGLLYALQGLPVVLSLPVGIMAYVALLFGLKVFSPEELSFVRRAWMGASGENT